MKFVITLSILLTGLFSLESEARPGRNINRACASECYKTKTGSLAAAEIEYDLCRFYAGTEADAERCESHHQYSIERIEWEYRWCIDRCVVAPAPDMEP